MNRCYFFFFYRRLWKKKWGGVSSLLKAGIQDDANMVPRVWTSLKFGPSWQFRFLDTIQLFSGSSLKFKWENRFKDFPSLMLKSFWNVMPPFSIRKLEVLTIHKASASVVFKKDKSSGYGDSKWFFIWHQNASELWENRSVRFISEGSSAIFQQHLSVLWNISRMLVWACDIAVETTAPRKQFLHNTKKYLDSAFCNADECE